MAMPHTGTAIADRVHPVMPAGPLTNFVALKETRFEVVLLVTTIFSLMSSWRLCFALLQLQSVRCG